MIGYDVLRVAWQPFSQKFDAVAARHIRAITAQPGGARSDHDATDA